MEQPLVSIIIPTYNRAHIIGETLDSVLAQTYTNWECIIIDDGSTDNTVEVLNDYLQKDSRLKYHDRPKDRSKGANACRNYGYELSKGEYVNWFDDDDLMVQNFIDIKIKNLEKENYDFVFSKTMNILNNGEEYPMFRNKNKGKLINANNFIIGSITWCTPDFLARKSSLLQINFNEELKSGQEYNFFIKALFFTNNGLFIDKMLTKRRIHDNSIQEIQKKDGEKYRFNKYKVYLITYKEILNIADYKSLNHLLIQSMSKAYEIVAHKEQLPNLSFLIKEVIRNKGIFKTIIFISSLFFSFLLKRGYSLMEYSRK